MTDTKKPEETRVVLPVDPARRTEIDKQRVPMSARPYRLLALVKQDAVVRVQKEPDDTVMTWPHLLTIEFLAAGLMSIFLLLMGLFVNAPLEDLANGNITPAVAKAPWYFLGLQELLAYFHPTVAGVLVPTFVLVGAALIPYVDRGDILATRPSQRKTAVVLFSLFAGLGLFVTFVGIFFRGPGYSFVIPYLTFFPIGVPASISPSDPQETFRMSNYQVEPAAQTPGPDQGGPEVPAPRAGPGHLPTRAHPRLAGRRRGPVAARGHGGNGRVPVAEPPGQVRGQGQDRDVRRGGPPTRACRSTRASRPTSPRRVRSSSSSTRRSSASSPARTRPATAPRSTCARCTSAARTSAASPTPAQELLDGVPVPRLALRPPGHQGARAAVRAGAAEHGPLRAVVDSTACPTINTGKITLGPLPIAVGQPGIIPPLSPTGCI